MRSQIFKLGGILVISAMMAGCAAKKTEPAPPSWEKADTSDEAMRADYGLCGGGFDAAGKMNYDPSALAPIDTCMQSKGYKRLN